MQARQRVSMARRLRSFGLGAKTLDIAILLHVVALGVLSWHLLASPPPTPTEEKQPVATSVVHGGVNWVQPYRAARRIARERNQPLLVFALTGEPQAFH